MTDSSQVSSVAEVLVTTGAVSFRTEPFFQFTSGMESPVYVDNRQLLGHVGERSFIVGELVGLVSEVDAALVGIAGTATAGIPWAAWLADHLDLPLLYVRAQPKEWGHERAVEGTAPSGEVVVVEDLAFTAGSLASSVTNLRDAGFDVTTALTIVTYEIPRARQRLSRLGIEHYSLTTIDAALTAARQLGTLSNGQVAIVSGWLDRVRRQSGP